jgi:putative salt-induced outer membrane protein YdiY
MRLLLTLSLWLMLSPWCLAVSPDGAARESLYLKNGDRLTGISHGLTEGQIDWELPHGQRILIPIDDVDRLEQLLAPTPEQLKAAAEKASPDAAELLGPPLDASDLEIPEQKPRWRRVLSALSDDVYDWTKRFSVGGRIVDGNSKETNVDIAALFEKKTEDRFSQINAGGQFGQTNGTRGVNRWFANSTTDITTPYDPWVWFLNINDEYNERQNLDYRGTFATGPGLKLYNEDKRRLILRSGPAVTYELFHEPVESRVSPDWLSEMELKWPLTEAIQFEHRMTVHPSLHNISLVRASSNTSILWALDHEKRWNFRLGLQYQYLSEPNTGREPHDYWTTLQIVYQRK